MLIQQIEDKDYYLEMEMNQEYIKRAEMAEVYNNAARAYMLEPLYEWLEKMQERAIEGLSG